jgi:hypothetical protein
MPEYSLWHYWEDSAGNAWCKPGDNGRIACYSPVFLAWSFCCRLVLTGPLRWLGGPFGPPPCVSQAGQGHGSRTCTACFPSHSPAARVNGVSQAIPIFYATYLGDLTGLRPACAVSARDRQGHPEPGCRRRKSFNIRALCDPSGLTPDQHRTTSRHGCHGFARNMGLPLCQRRAASSAFFILHSAFLGPAGETRRTLAGHAPDTRRR